MTLDLPDVPPLDLHAAAGPADVRTLLPVGRARASGAP